MATKSYDLKGRKLYVAVPTYDHRILIKAAISLSKLCLQAERLGVAVSINHISGCSLISSARNMLVDEFLSHDFTDLLFLDSDIAFEPRDILKLLAAATEHDVVAGVPRMRNPDKRYLCVFQHAEDGSLMPNEFGLFRATRASTSLMMIPRHVLETLRDAHPEWKYHDRISDKDIYAFFDTKVTPGGFIGEDYLFCDRVREHGMKVWVDPAIKLGHVGTMEFEGDLKQDLIDSMKASDTNPMSSVA